MIHLTPTTPKIIKQVMLKHQVRELLKDNHIQYSEDLFSIYINMTLVCYKIFFPSSTAEYKIFLGDLEIGNSYLHNINKLEAIESIIEEIYKDLDYGTPLTMKEVA